MNMWMTNHLPSHKNGWHSSVPWCVKSCSMSYFWAWWWFLVRHYTHSANPVCQAISTTAFALTWIVNWFFISITWVRHSWNFTGSIAWFHSSFGIFKHKFKFPPVIRVSPFQVLSLGLWWQSSGDPAVIHRSYTSTGNRSAEKEWGKTPRAFWVSRWNAKA